MTRPSIVPDVRYLPVGHKKKMREMLRYFEYREGSLRIALRREPTDERYRWRSWEEREGVQDHLPALTVDPRTGDRWVDRGLGKHWRDIMQQLDELEGEHIQARSYVISPDPQLMQHVEEQERLMLLARTTEEVMQRFYEDRGWGDPQFSYVMHDRDTNERDPAGKEQDVQQMLHAHVITPGTHIGDYGRRESQPKFIRAERLHELTRDVFERRLERSLGRDRFHQLMRERERELDPEQERQVPARSGPELELGR